MSNSRQNTAQKIASSNRCVTPYNFFQSDQEQCAAQQLLNCVLKPSIENISKATEICKKNPGALFIESTAEEYAAGLDENLANVRRMVQASPIGAIISSGDRWLFKEIIELNAFKQYIDPASNKSAYELAIDEIKKQFPSGFDYPKSTYDYVPLINAIANDQSLIRDNVPKEATKALLAQFRKDFLPGTVTSGHFFNPNELLRAFDLYHANWQPWNGNQLSLFWCQVIGYLQRLVTGVFADVLDQGIQNIVDGSKHLERHYDNNNHIVDATYENAPIECDFHRRNYKIFHLYPNTVDRLGLSFGVDSYHILARYDGRMTGAEPSARRAAFIKYMEQQQQAWAEIYATLTEKARLTCSVKSLTTG